jgi:hypothetical protein
MKIATSVDGAGAVTITATDRPTTFRAAGATLRPNGDAALALALVPAMHGGQDIEIPEGLTQRLAHNAAAVQGVLEAFFGYHRVTVHADVSPDAPRGEGVGSFFSGGVDSFHTARRRPDVDTLVFVQGFDITLEKTELRRQAIAAARDAAAQMGKRLIEVTTDLKDDPVLNRDWGAMHGPAMATVAHLLSGELKRVYIPATYTYADLFPWGSHPMLDPLWSGDRVEIIHDGAEVTRFDKIGELVDDPVAQSHLRVCWENRGGAYNCGQCEKCTRTMIALRAHGALDRFARFDRPLNLKKVRVGSLNHRTQIAFTEQGLRRLTETRADPQLANALRWRLRIGPHRHRARLAARAVRNAVRRGWHRR